MADDHVRCTYNDVHKLIAKASERIQSEFAADTIIAIGGGSVALLSNEQFSNTFGILEVSFLPELWWVLLKSHWTHKGF